MHDNETHNDESIARLIAAAFNTDTDHAHYLAENFWPYLQTADLERLRQITRLPDSHLRPFVAARELLRENHENAPIMQHARAVADHAMRHYGGNDQEHVIIYALNSANTLIQSFVLYIGTINETKLRIAECFKDAIRINAPAIILVHNHPSGVPQPSRDDIAITTTLISAGKLLDINVLDHIIIGAETYTSIRAMFPNLWDEKGARR